MNNILLNINETNLRDMMLKIPRVKLEDNKEYETFDYYDYIKNLWISKISTINDRLILNSNHFINLLLEKNDLGQETGIYKGEIKRKSHYIYSRIIQNYSILNKKDKMDIINDIKIIKDKCIYLHSSFSGGNVGHELFYILNVLDKYKNDHSIKFVLFEEIYNNNNKIIELLISKSRIIKIKQKTIYNFKRQIFLKETDFFKSYDFIPIIYNIRNRILKLYDNLDLKQKNVILIKNKNQKKIVRYEDCFESNILFEHLKSKNWYICDPENDDFYKLAYILLNAKIIITSQRGISCFNQIFFNFKAIIIGFIKNNKNKFELVDNDYYLDPMCNGLYFSILNYNIITPLRITNLNQIKKTILEVENLSNDNNNIEIFNNVRLSCNMKCFSDNKVNLLGKNNKFYNYGSKIPFTTCIKLLNSDLNIFCNQIIYNKESKCYYPMIQSKFKLNKNKETNWISIYRNNKIKNKKKIYIYDLEELDNITFSFPELQPEMDLFDLFYIQLINNYEITNNIKEAEIAFIPMDFLKLIYISPFHEYSKVPLGCPSRAGNIIGLEGIKAKYNHIKFFWNKFIKRKLHKFNIPHFLLYSYVLFDIDLSYIPKEIIILSYENKISFHQKLECKKPKHNIIPIPYILNENKEFKQSKIYTFNQNLNRLNNFKNIDIAHFGSIDGKHTDMKGLVDYYRPILFHYRNFINFIDLGPNINFYKGKALEVEKYFKRIKYLFVLRGDTISRLCFYQCFAFNIVPIIFESQIDLYNNLLLEENDISIIDSCLILPDVETDLFLEKITNIIKLELKNNNNYENKIKNHKKIFDNFNWFSSKPLNNIINHLTCSKI
jgi:hypothetical protein